MKLCGLSPNSYIHVSVSDLCIPTFGLRIFCCCCRKIGGPSWEYIKSLTQIHECGNWDKGHAVSFLGVHKSDFLCSEGLSKIAAVGFLKRISLKNLAFFDDPETVPLKSKHTAAYTRWIRTPSPSDKTPTVICPIVLLDTENFRKICWNRLTLFLAVVPTVCYISPAKLSTIAFSLS